MDISIFALHFFYIAIFFAAGVVVGSLGSEKYRTVINKFLKRKQY